MKIYKVGGVVRDQILGIKPNDTDYVVVGSTFEEMQNLGYIPIGRRFPIFLHPETKEEYALARKEVKIGQRHGDFEFIFTPDITLQEDLGRRDLTCNAIAYDDETGEYIDYFNGIEDIQNKVLRCVHSKHFVEDPLRVLRVCRFKAQLNFEVDQKTKRLCINMVKKGEMSYLSPERICGELFKALQCKYTSNFFTCMRDFGALKVLMPEIDCLFDIKEDGEIYGVKTIGEKIMKALDLAQDEKPIIKFGILMSAFDQIASSPDETEKKVNAFCNRLKLPESFKCLARSAALYSKNFMNIIETSAADLYEINSKLVFEKRPFIKELIKICSILFKMLHKDTDDDIKKQTKLFALNSEMLKMVYKDLRKIKATDVPNFKELPKDKTFGKIFKAFKINSLEKRIAKFKKIQGLS